MAESWTRADGRAGDVAFADGSERSEGFGEVDRPEGLVSGQSYDQGTDHYAGSVQWSTILRDICDGKDTVVSIASIDSPQFLRLHVYFFIRR